VTATTTELYELIAGGAIGVAIVVYVTFTLLRRYRLRRLQEVRAGASAPQQASDRAYNRLALARKEADMVASQGGDVERAQQLIDLSDQSLKRREFDRAYELAQAAHETLVKARKERGPPRSAPSPAPTAAEPLRPAAVGTGAGNSGGSPSAGPPAPTGAKARAEAQFQLRLFEQELAKAAKDGPDTSEVIEGRELYVQAHAAFSSSEYAEAFRLSLRGRRRIGGHVESLAPSPAAVAASPPPKLSAEEVARSAEEVASQERCPLCGHPTVAGDAFCRGCGAERAPNTCPKCGASRRPQDSFCGRCGQRYDKPAA